MEIQFQYDEDLSRNPFFKKLQTEHKIILDTAPLENWIVCVPRMATIKQKHLTNSDFLLSHILIPNDELPDTHFTNLLGIDIVLLNRRTLFNQKLNIESTILFDEIYYTKKSSLKYKVWCIEHPIDYFDEQQNDMTNILGGSEIVLNNHNNNNNTSMDNPSAPESKSFNNRNVRTKTNESIHNNNNNGSSSSTPLIIHDLNNAYEFILNESGKRNEIFQKIENACTVFLRNNNNKSTRKTLSQLKISIQLLMKHCLHMVVYQNRLNGKCQEDQQFYRLLKISVETVVMNFIYDYVIDVISTNCIPETEHFNHILRNLFNVQTSDFHIDEKHFDAIKYVVRMEIMKIEVCRTVIDKLGCLRRALNVAGRSKHMNLSVDELIPIFVYVIIKSGITHWISILIFLKDFLFNELTMAADKGADSFLITQLEATITFIRSINIQTIKSFQLSSPSISLLSLPTLTSSSQLQFKTREDFINHIFHLVINEREQEIIELFKDSSENSNLVTITGNNNNNNNNNENEINMDVGNDDHSINNNNNNNNGAAIRYKSSTEATEASKINNKKLIETDIKELCHPLCNCERCSLVMIDQQISINVQNQHGLNCAHITAKYGLPKILHLLLAFNINIHTVDENNWTPLHYAAANGYQHILLLLLHAGANINAINFDKCTALHLAAANGQNSCVKAILYYADHMDVPLDKNGQNKNGDTPLHLAVKWCFIEIIESLLEYGARLDIVNRLGHTILDYAHNSFVTRILQSTFLITDESSQIYGGNTGSKTTSTVRVNQMSTNRQSTSSTSTTSTTSSTSSPSITSSIINTDENCNKHSSKPRIIDNLNTTKTTNDKVIAAIRNFDTKLAFFFLNNNFYKQTFERTQSTISTESTSTDDSVNSLTASSSASSSDSIIQNLINTHINEYNCDGITPFLVAVEYGNYDIVKYLLTISNRNGSANVINKFTKQNCLHIAIEQYEKSIKNSTANTTTTTTTNNINNNNNNNNHKINKQQFIDIIELILMHVKTTQSEMDLIELLNGQDENGDTILHYAIRQGNERIVKMLIDSSKYNNLHNDDDDGGDGDDDDDDRDGDNVGVSIKYHLNVELKNCDGKTAYDLAKFYMFFNILKLFNENGSLI